MHASRKEKRRGKEYKLIYGRGVDVVLSQDNGNERGGEAAATA